MAQHNIAPFNDINNLQLDQLWYTWSTSGLGSMPMGYRVRAASPGLYDTLSMRYRLLDRFLQYELPQGANNSEFNSRIAPVTLAFVNNGSEMLLLRKVFTGGDAAGRKGNFFTHLIAGLPPDFSARDAIRLWSSDLWDESDQKLAPNPNETRLPTIPYSRLRTYVEQSQTRFNLEPIKEQLQSLLSLILIKERLPSHIYARGQSLLIAALIYGITHCLPINVLGNFTFSTYESKVMEGETTVFTGTISGSELNDSSGLQVQPALSSTPISSDIQRFVQIAITALLNDETTKFYRLRGKIERQNHNTPAALSSQADQATLIAALLDQFNNDYRKDPLTLSQLERIVLHPADNLDNLLDPGVQQEGAHLLLSQPEYWAERGQRVFTTVRNWLDPTTRPPFNQETRDALAACINGMAAHVFNAIRDEILQGTIPKLATAVLGWLVDLRNFPAIYQRMLTEFAQEPLYGRITSAPFWGVQFWLLQCAQLIQPQPALQVMQPWLHIPSWDKLDKVLKLNLPIEWEYAAIYERVQGEVNPTAISVVKVNEPKFTQFLQSLLEQSAQPGKEGYISLVLRFFGALIQLDANDHSYPKRAELLLALLNVVPTRPEVIDQLISLFPLNSPYQLVEKELDLLLSGCAPEVIAASAQSFTLFNYQKDFILSLMPRKLNRSTIALLKQFQQSALAGPLPTEIVHLVSSWLAINALLESRTFNPSLLHELRKALDIIVPQIKKRYIEAGQDSKRVGTMFAQELIPHVLPMVTTEYEIESVLAIFQDGPVEHPWNVLQVMARYAGSAFTEDLSQLTPYLLCGIRRQQANPTAISQDHLDGYLKDLYVRVSENALGDVDKAASARVWPAEVKREWDRWRKSQRGGGFLAGIPGVNRMLAGQQKPQTGPKPDQNQPPQHNPHAGGPPAGGHPANPAGMAQQSANTMQPSAEPQKKLIISPTQPPAYNMGQAVTMPAQEQSIMATIYDQPFPIAYSRYSRLSFTFIKVLPYWINEVLAGPENANYSKDLRKALANEQVTVSNLLDELKHSQPTTILPAFIQYLVDDQLIIYEIERPRKQGDPRYGSFLNPANYLRVRKEEFIKFERGVPYQELTQTRDEQSISEALQILILRYHFIKGMINDKKDWGNWIKNERKHTKSDYSSEVRAKP